MKGKFIVIEGIDGCGKTTQINELCKWLPNSGLMSPNSTLITTREPGGSQLGVKLRELILNNEEQNPPSPLTELLLYSADRAEHITKKISPSLQNGDWILCDRFTGSTVAYQGYGRNINFKIVKELENIVCQGEKPDLTIFLDLSPEESILRREKKIPDRIESEGIHFLKKVNEGFHQLAQDKTWVTIKASAKKDFISNQIKEILIRKFKS